MSKKENIAKEVGAARKAGNTAISMVCKIYKANGTIITGGANLGGYTFQPSSVSQIYTAINTPTIHYNGNGGSGVNDYGWFSSNPDSWTRANNPITLTAKSIFDPCPYGYRVPTTNANSNGNSDFFGFPTPPLWSINIINGQSWLGSWWPVPDCRNYNSAIQGSVGNYGYYWSASPNPSNPYAAYYLFFRSEGVGPASSFSRSFGFSLRCVQE